jgi:hypothetical protein
VSWGVAFDHNDSPFTTPVGRDSHVRIVWPSCGNADRRERDTVKVAALD